MPEGIAPTEDAAWRPPGPPKRVRICRRHHCQDFDRDGGRPRLTRFFGRETLNLLAC
jgi:hypothetical protein